MQSKEVVNNLKEYEKIKKELTAKLREIDKGFWMIEDRPQESNDERALNNASGVRRTILYSFYKDNPVCRVLRRIKESCDRCKSDHCTVAENSTNQINSFTCWADMKLYHFTLRFGGEKRVLLIIGQRYFKKSEIASRALILTNKILAERDKQEGEGTPRDFCDFLQNTVKDCLEAAYNESASMPSKNQIEIDKVIKEYKEKLENLTSQTAFSEVAPYVRIYNDCKQLKRLLYLENNNNIQKWFDSTRSLFTDADAECRLSSISHKEPECLISTESDNHWYHRAKQLEEHIKKLENLSSLKYSTKKLLMFCISASLALLINLATWYENGFYFIHPILASISLMGTAGFGILSYWKIKCQS